MGQAFGDAALNRLIFNHHSLPYPAKEDAKKAVPLFLKLCLALRRYGLQTILFNENQDSTWHRIGLAPGYFWQDWFNENLDKESERAFRLISTKSPLFEIGEALDLDVRLPNKEHSYSVLRAAVFFGYPIVSYPTQTPWNQKVIAVWKEFLDEQGNLQNETAAIDNWYQISDREEAELRKRQEDSVRMGKEIWTQRSQLYPFLIFNGETKVQLNKWGFSPQAFDAVKNALSILNLFAEQWAHQQFPDYRHQYLQALGLPRVSGESESVANDAKKRAEREFFLPSGEKVFFGNHIKLQQGIRIHFFADTNSQKIYVGYIWKHLAL